MQNNNLKGIDMINQIATKKINGLQYIENYITSYQENWLLNEIDKYEWLDDLKRKVQHYGFKYNYKERKVTLDQHIGVLPEWLKRISKNLFNQNYMHVIPDQVIINEYLPGQGISPHIDCEPCFEDTIISLSLGSRCIMDFSKKNNQSDKIPIYLEPRSIIILRNDARYNWSHCIPARKSDKWIDGNIYKRIRRVSITFRKVILT